MYFVSLILDLLWIYIAKKIQILCHLSEKSLVKHLDFINIFLKKLAIELHKYLSIKN